jgi:hypothetical protein
VLKGTEISITGEKVKELEIVKAHLSLLEFQAFVDRYLNALLSGTIDEIDAGYLLYGKRSTISSRRNFPIAAESPRSEPLSSPASPAPAYTTSNKSSKPSTQPQLIKSSISPTKRLYRDSHTSRLRQVQSKLKPQLAQDRKQYHQQKTRVEEPVIEILAKNRIDDLLSSDTDSSVSYVSTRRYYDPNSGSSALAIAEAFLNGSVAKDLATLRDHERETNESPIDDDYHLAAAKLDPESIYRGGWEMKRNAWVADFGLPHTRAVKSDGLDTASVYKDHQ